MRRFTGGEVFLRAIARPVADDDPRARATVSSVLPQSMTSRSSVQATDAKQASMCADSLRVMMVAVTPATRADYSSY